MERRLVRAGLVRLLAPGGRGHFFPQRQLVCRRSAGGAPLHALLVPSLLVLFRGVQPRASELVLRLWSPKPLGERRNGGSGLRDRPARVPLPCGAARGVGSLEGEDLPATASSGRFARRSRRGRALMRRAAASLSPRRLCTHLVCPDRPGSGQLPQRLALAPARSRARPLRTAAAAARRGPLGRRRLGNGQLRGALQVDLHGARFRRIQALRNAPGGLSRLSDSGGGGVQCLLVRPQSSGGRMAARRGGRGRRLFRHRRARGGAADGAIPAASPVGARGPGCCRGRAASTRRSSDAGVALSDGGEGGSRSLGGRDRRFRADARPRRFAGGPGNPQGHGRASRRAARSGWRQDRGRSGATGTRGAVAASRGCGCTRRRPQAAGPRDSGAGRFELPSRHPVNSLFVSLRP